LCVVDYGIVPSRLSFRAGPIEAMNRKASTFPGKLAENVPSVAPATDQATRLNMLHGPRGHQARESKGILTPPDQAPIALQSGRHGFGPAFLALRCGEMTKDYIGMPLNDGRQDEKAVRRG
jgi:hypothetical protein